NLQKELGITFVYVTHSQSEAFSMADRVVIMSRGKVEQIGNPQEIYRTPRTRFVAEFLGSSNLLSGTVTRITEGLAHIATPSAESAGELNPAKALKEGAPATFVVAGDRGQLSGQRPPEGVNALEAMVIGEEFVGATAVVHREGE